MSLDRLEQNGYFDAKEYSSVRGHFSGGVKKRCFQPGEIIHRDGDRADHLSLLVEGKVFVYSETANGLTRATGLFTPLSLLGEELKMNEGYFHPTNAKALVPSILLVLDRRILPEVFENDRELSQRLFQGLNSDTDYLVRRIKTLGKLKAVHKIADVLLDISGLGQEPLVKACFNQERIGELAHVGRVVVNNYIGSMRDAGILGTRGKDLFITPMGFDCLRIIGEGYEIDDAVEQSSKVRGGMLTPVPRESEHWNTILTSADTSGSY